MKTFVLFSVFLSALAHASPVDSVEAEIKKDIGLSKQYDLRIDQRAIAAMHVFVLREAKNSCSYLSDEPAKQSACLQKALERAEPAATELCKSEKANSPELSKCLRTYIKNFTPALKDYCADVKGFRSSSCTDSADEAEKNYALFMKKYDKDAEGREKREAKSKSTDFIADSSLGTKLLEYSDSREKKAAGGTRSADGTK